MATSAAPSRTSRGSGPTAPSIWRKRRGGSAPKVAEGDLRAGWNARKLGGSEGPSTLPLSFVPVLKCSGVPAHWLSSEPPSFRPSLLAEGSVEYDVADRR